MKTGRETKTASRRDFVKAAASGLGAAAALAGIDVLSARAALSDQPEVPARWDRDADVIVVGTGATGLPAAIQAAQDGASVIMIDANTDVGGHAILSGGNVALGGGTSAQKKYGISDSADTVFSDLTDWSVVESNGFPDYRYNDRELIRAFADNSAPTFEWLVAQGVVFVDKIPDRTGGAAVGNSAPRENHAAPMAWPQVETGVPVPAEIAATGSSGIGFIRPLEATARKMGIPILLEHRMTRLVRENQNSGRVLGIVVTHQGKRLNFRARKGVIIGTGGHTSNVNFRRIFDPRLTEEYQVAGEPYSFQDASGELSAMAVGASLWGAYNQVGEFGGAITKAGHIGCQYGYVNLTWDPKSPVFSRARASGLRVQDYQNVILVNQRGWRFSRSASGRHQLLSGRPDVA